VITLPADVEASIREKVERGDYADAGEVVREALRFLDDRDRQLAELRAKLQPAIDQLDRGDGIPFTPQLMEEIRREAAERFRRGEQPNPDVCP
jgi:antitoxin ParD1/3/4